MHGLALKKVAADSENYSTKVESRKELAVLSLTANWPSAFFAAAAACVPRTGNSSKIYHLTGGQGPWSDPLVQCAMCEG
jgi:hypothetical protein